MDNKNNIIRYFDNQMSENEKLLFEQELISSSNLKKDFDDYKIFLAQFDETKNIELNNDNLNNIVPNFRERIDKSKKSKIFSTKFIFAGSALAIVILAFVLFVLPSNNKSNSVQQIAAEMNSEEINNTLSDYLSNVNYSQLNLSSSADYDSVFTNILGSELNPGSNINLDLISYNTSGLSQLEDYISENEAENIYNEILNKNFFKE